MDDLSDDHAHDDAPSLLDLPLIPLEAIVTSPLLGALEIKALRATCRQCMGLVEARRIGRLTASVNVIIISSSGGTCATHEGSGSGSGVTVGEDGGSLSTPIADFLARCLSLRALTLHVADPYGQSGRPTEEGGCLRRGTCQEGAAQSSDGSGYSDDGSSSGSMGDGTRGGGPSARGAALDGLKAVQAMFAAALAASSFSSSSAAAGKTPRGCAMEGMPDAGDDSSDSSSDESHQQGHHDASLDATIRPATPTPSNLSTLLSTALPQLRGLESLSLHEGVGGRSLLGHEWDALEKCLPEACRWVGGACLADCTFSSSGTSWGSCPPVRHLSLSACPPMRAGQLLPILTQLAASRSHLLHITLQGQLDVSHTMTSTEPFLIQSLIPFPVLTLDVHRRLVPRPHIPRG